MKKAVVSQTSSGIYIYVRVSTEEASFKSNGVISDANRLYVLANGYNKVSAVGGFLEIST